MEWISVKDRLPERKREKDVHVECIVHEKVMLDRPSVTTAWWMFDDAYWNDGLGCRVDGIDKWMPLPAPPTEATND